MGFTSNNQMQILPPHLASQHQQPPAAPWNNHHHCGGSRGGRGRGGGREGGHQRGGSQGAGRGQRGPHRGSQGSGRGVKRGGGLTEENLGCSMNEYFKQTRPNSQNQAWAPKPHGYRSNPHDTPANKHNSYNSRQPSHNNKNNSFHGSQGDIPTGPKTQTQSHSPQSNLNSKPPGDKRKFSTSELPPAKVQRLEAYVTLHQPVDFERDVYMCDCSEAWSQACAICHENLKREFLRLRNLNEQLSFHRTLFITLCQRNVVVQQSLNALIEDFEAETGIVSSDDSEMSDFD